MQLQTAPLHELPARPALPTRRSRHKLAAACNPIEPLELRVLLTATLDPSGLLSVVGTDNPDTITLSAAGGILTVDEGGGNTNVFNVSDVQFISVDGGAGNDTITIQSGVIGATLLGGLGDDTLTGGDGNDTLDGGAGADVMSGGAGTDLVDYSARTNDLVITLDGLANDGEAGEQDNVNPDIERIFGGAGDDSITGDNGGDMISGRGGNDTINGGGGNDNLDGGNGNDVINGGDGADVITGGIGIDVINGGTGNDTIDAGAGNDTVDGGIGDDSITGGDGNDSLFGNDGNDVFVAADGLADTINGGNGNDTAQTYDAGLDTLIAIETPAPPAPQLSVFRGATTFINGSTTFDFGSLTQGDPGAERTFSVENNGTATLTLSNLAVPTGYTITQSFAASLAPGVTDTFSVRLESAALGAKNGQISFNSNDPNQNPFIFSVTGSVIAPATPQISVTSSAGPVVNGTSTIDFGSITQSTDTASETFTVTNDGTGTLTLGAVSTPTGFTLTDGLPASLAPAASTTFSVRLDNLVAGDKTGDISFATNDTQNNPFSFHVAGHVKAPRVTVSTNTGSITDGVTTVNYGGVVRGISTTTKAFTVRNTGDGTLVLGPVKVPTGYTVITDLPASLAAGGSTTFSVRLDNAVAGTKTGSFRFHTNVLDHSPFTFPVTGVVKAPVLAVMLGTTTITNNTTTPINFGTLAQGASPISKTYTVKNTGNAPLTLSAVTVPSGFSVIKQPPTTLAPATSTTFIVRLVAGSAGTKSGSVKFLNNDIFHTPFAFAVTGKVTGVSAIFYASGTLRLIGTTGPDIITFSGSSGSLSAYNHGQLIGTFAGVKKIQASGYEGNDSINMGNLSIPGYLDGGAGNDTLTGGSGNDTLHGGDGSDQLTGGYGVDALYGEAGDDVLDAVDGTPDAVIDGGSGSNTIRRDPVDPH